MKLILEKLNPKNIEKELKELLIKHRSKQFVFNQKDFGYYNRLVRLSEMKRSFQRKQNIYTYLTLWVFCIAIMLMAYGSLYVINYLMML